MTTILPPPHTFGMPEKFTEWREMQDIATAKIVKTEKRYIMEVQPTGSGKSLCYMSAAILNGGRTLVLTSTKALQDQLLREFSEMSSGKVAIVKGKSAYKCPVSHVTCNYGPCALGYKCKFRRGGCPYYDAIAAANAADIVVTNYAFWTSNEPDVLGEFKLLALDEAHACVSHLLDGLSLKVYKSESEMYLPWPENGKGDNSYISWLKTLLDMVKADIEVIKLGNAALTQDTRAIIDFAKRLNTIEEMQQSNMIVEHAGKTINFDPTWPTKMAEKYLFRGIEKVLLTSATVTKKTAELLGIADEELDYSVFPSMFPVNRRPVYFVPTVRVDHRITNSGLNLWFNRIDQIINSRRDRKGIVHTVSYDRRSRLMNASKHSDIMLGHATKDVVKKVEAFKAMQAPAVLVSPSVVTGWDFPDDECRWQIIGKIPFPDSRSKVMKARQAIDKEYGCYLAMQALEQAPGRGMRAQDDWCETFIIDDHFKWFIHKYRAFASDAFLSAVRVVKTLPGRLEV